MNLCSCVVNSQRLFCSKKSCKMLVLKLYGIQIKYFSIYNMSQKIKNKIGLFRFVETLCISFIFFTKYYLPPIIICF